jgi:general secretion pathway protein E
VRTLCNACRAPAEPMSEALWGSFTQSSPDIKPGNPYRAVGCLECRMTGYRGRAGLFEVMLMSTEVRRVIANGASLDELRAQAVREGMRTLRASGAEKIAQGLTTAMEVERVAPAF